MNQQPPQDGWDAAFSQSLDLDPTPECWGIFAYSDAPPPVCGSGMGSFHWFQTEGELISFIRGYLAWWTPAPSSMKPEDIAAEVQAIVDAESGELTTMVDRLNEFMRNMWCIGWYGQFVELCEGTGAFPVKVRGSFCDDDEVPEAISQEKIEEFKEYLQTYGI
jgi:hypothetical protein